MAFIRKAEAGDITAYLKHSHDCPDSNRHISSSSAARETDPSDGDEKLRSQSPAHYLEEIWSGDCSGAHLLVRDSNAHLLAHGSTARLPLCAPLPASDLVCAFYRQMLARIRPKCACDRATHYAQSAFADHLAPQERTGSTCH